MESTDSELLRMQRRVLQQFCDALVLRPSCRRYEWSELRFYHRWYLKLLGKQPPFRPYKLQEVNSDNVVSFKRPTPYEFAKVTPVNEIVGDS